MRRECGTTGPDRPYRVITDMRGRMSLRDAEEIAAAWAGGHISFSLMRVHEGFRLMTDLFFRQVPVNDFHGTLLQSSKPRWRSSRISLCH